MTSATVPRSRETSRRHVAGMRWCERCGFADFDVAPSIDLRDGSFVTVVRCRNRWRCAERAYAVEG